MTIRHPKRLWTVAVALVLAGCGSDIACTAMGCVSEASLRLHDLSSTMRYPLTAHACFDQHCADVIIDRQPPPAGGDLAVQSCTGNGRIHCADFRSTGGYVSIAFDDAPPGGQAHSATVVVRDSHNTVVLRSSRQLRLTEFAPNGARCAPICWSGTTDLR